MDKNTKETTQKDRKYVNILGINIASTDINEVLTGVEQKISRSIESDSGARKFSILTPNPELIVMSQNNVELKNALNSATYSIPDGVGLSYASKFLYGKELNIIPGRKLFDELIKLAVKRHWKVFLLGGMDNEAQLATEKLKTGNSLETGDWRLEIGFHPGPCLDENAEPETEVDKRLQQDAVDKINKFAPDLLFVAFGNPKQEIWVMKNAKKLNAKCVMAVGGTFRYVASLSKLPPKWMEKAGLEWVYRLVTEPYRFGRIFNAFPIFPLKVFLSKYSGN